MESVIVYGDRRDGQLTAVLRALLSRTRTVYSLSEERLKAVGRGEAVALVETERLREIDLENGILVLKSGAKISTLHAVHKTTNVVVNAADARNISRLARFLPNVYTCGFSSKDFVTFSSRNEENTVVSLQRGLRLPGGVGFVEPFEIPCAAAGELREYPILASVLTGILLGVINENKCKEIGKICFSYQNRKRT